MCFLSTKRCPSGALGHPSTFATDTGRLSRSVGPTGLSLSVACWLHVVSRNLPLLSAPALSPSGGRFARRGLILGSVIGKTCFADNEQALVYS